MTGKRHKLFTTLLLVFVLLLGMIPGGCDFHDRKDVSRTVMLYGIGSNLEGAHGSLTYNLMQIMDAEFPENMHFIVLTGGAVRWFTPEDRLFDKDGNPAAMDASVMQLWEISGKTGDTPGKMTLLKNLDEFAEKPMTDPACLEWFITYGRENYKADKYDLILWDHGYGPMGYGCDNAVYCTPEKFEFEDCPMRLDELAGALKNSMQGEKFELIDFDACLMCNVEVMAALSDYADYMVLSAERSPEFGQEYSGWITRLKNNPGMSGYEIGKVIVDDCIAFYNDPASGGYGRPATLAVVNMEHYNEKMLAPTAELTKLLAEDIILADAGNTYYDKLCVSKTAFEFATVGLFDIKSFANELATVDEKYKAAADSISDALSDEENVIYYRGTAGYENCGGVSFFFPSADAPYTAQYVICMEYLKEQLAASDAKNAKERAGIIENQLTNAAGYRLVQETGYAVSKLLDEGNKKPDYENVKKSWEVRAEFTKKQIEYSEEVGTLLDESILKTPMESGIARLTDTLNNVTDADAFLSGVIDIQAQEIAADINCKLQKYACTGTVTVAAKRKITDSETREEKRTDYDAVIGHLYGDDLEDVAAFEDSWYAVTDAAGKSHLACVETSPQNPNTATVRLIAKEIQEVEGYDPFVLNVPVVLTADISGDVPKLTAINKIEAGEYAEFTKEELAESKLYTGYVTGGYSDDILSEKQELTVDPEKEYFGLSLSGKVKLGEIDDVDAARASSVKVSYTLKNIYGYLKEVTRAE